MLSLNIHKLEQPLVRLVKTGPVFFFIFNCKRTIDRAKLHNLNEIPKLADGARLLWVLLILCGAWNWIHFTLTKPTTGDWFPLPILVPAPRWLLKRIAAIPLKPKLHFAMLYDPVGSGCASFAFHAFTRNFYPCRKLMRIAGCNAASAKNVRHLCTAG